LAISVIMSPFMIESSEGADRPAEAGIEPVMLCYYNDGINLVDTYYALPGKAIGTANIPPTSGAINYWIRMDTGEVVTYQSTFEPGTYMIKGYTVAPEPWGSSAAPSSGSFFDLSTIALAIAVVDFVGIIYLIFKRK